MKTKKNAQKLTGNSTACCDGMIAAPRRNMKSPLAKARDKWLASAEGKGCTDPCILKDTGLTPFLQNRIVMAFIAGANWTKS